jgi:hypothetical protein
MTAQELEAQLRDIGARRYHRLHPFHALLHGGNARRAKSKPGRSTATITRR